MPKSRNRKNHKKKVEARRKRLESKKRDIQHQFNKLIEEQMKKRNNTENNIEENTEENV